MLSGQTIDVITDTGSIAMRDAKGGLSGTLSLSASVVRAVTASALKDISSATSLELISARLDQNDGIVKDGGSLAAGTIDVFAQDAFFIQNTGPSPFFPDRRGFTANSLLISNYGTNTDIAINGAIDGISGLITGTDTQHSVLLNGQAITPGGPFNPLSTINGCVIGRECQIPIDKIAPPEKIIDKLPEPPGVGAPDEALVLPIIQYGPTPLIDSPPLIDEPVTGLGNDDLWQQR